MKTEDDLNEEIVTTIKPDGTVEPKRHIKDEETIAAMDFEEAQAAFLVAEKKFRHLSEHPNVVSNPKINCRWWCALEELYQCDKKLWLLFVGQDRSVRSNVMYNDYKNRLVMCRHTNVNA